MTIQKAVILLKDKEDNSEFENIVSAFLVTKKNPLLTKIKDNKEKIADMSRQRPSSLSVKRTEGGGVGADHFSLVTGMGANKKVKLRRLMTLKKGSAGERGRDIGESKPSHVNVLCYAIQQGQMLIKEGLSLK